LLDFEIEDANEIKMAKFGGYDVFFNTTPHLDDEITKNTKRKT